MAEVGIDPLSMLSLKVASNVFDISSGLLGVSIRDQVVRAQLLARDLVTASPDIECVVIIGAGVAGLAAAASILNENATRAHPVTVHIVEQSPHLLPLFRGNRSRRVGPFMYEWPASLHKDQTYPGNHSHLGAGPVVANMWASTEPMTADDLRSQLISWWNSLTPLHLGKVHVHHGVDPNVIKLSVKKFVACAQSNLETYLANAERQTGAPLAPSCPFTLREMGANSAVVNADYVILAMGMGGERVKHPDYPNLEGPPFWSNDALVVPQTADESVGVFGGGDGALQDVLRALTGHADPLEMMSCLTQTPLVGPLIEKHHAHLMEMELQSRLLRTWTTKGSNEKNLDEACEAVAASLAAVPEVAAAVLQQIRTTVKGEVVHVVKESHFTKAYLLNRFLVHLIGHCLAEQHWPGFHGMRYQLLRGWSVTGVSKAGSKTNVAVVGLVQGKSQARTFVFDQVAVRYGVHSDLAASGPSGQMIQLSALDSNHRIELSRIPLPFWMPDA